MKKKLTQTQIKEKQERAKKIKHLLIRSLNIICYVLSVLFIIMAVAVSAQSCNNKEKQSASIESNKNIQFRNDGFNDATAFNYLYTLKYTEETAIIPFDTQLELIEHYDISRYWYQSAQPSNVYKGEKVSGLYELYSGELYEVTDIEISFSYGKFNGDVWEPHIDYVVLKYNDVWRNVLTAKSGSVDNYNALAVFGTKLLAAQELNDSYQINWFYNVSEISPLNFTFNNQINYNATFGGVIGQPFLTANISGSYKDLDFGLFLSGGKIWNTIRVYWLDASNGAFKLEDGSIHEEGNSTRKYFSYMEYRNTLTGEGVMVNQRNSIAYKNGNALSWYFDLSSTWISSNYQTITLLTNTSEINITELNKYNNISSVGGSITTGGNIGLEQGFSIITTSFSSIIPFLAIQVLPGISIGLLLFIPLIVVIIILVFRVVKK